MRMLGVIFASALAVGLLGFCTWCVWVFTTKEYAGADWTTAVIYRTGQGVIWLAALLVAGSVLGGAAAATWKAIGP